MAYSEKEWEMVRAFYESGLSLSAITKRPEVKITDRATISKKAKRDGWVKAKNSTLIDKEVQLKLDVAEIEKKKATINSTALYVTEKLVDERTRHLTMLNNATEKNISILMSKVDKSISIMDHRNVQVAIKDAKETVIGKAPDIVVNNANIQQNTNPREMTDEQLIDFLNS